MITAAQRMSLVKSGQLIFQKASQRADLLDPAKTNDGLIAYLLCLCIVRRHHFEVTAVTSDHPTNDGGPDGRGHNAGCAIDGAPLSSPKEGAWIAANTVAMRQFLRDAAQCGPYQIGLVGPSNDPANFYDNQANMAAAGRTAFHDEGGPHVHLGARKVVKGVYVD